MKTIILITAIFWSHLALGQSEPITSLQGQTGSKFTSPKLVVPYSQATRTNLGGLIETGNENMLLNPSFEAGTTSWTCTTGTCTSETTIFSSGKKALKVVPAANIFDVSQQITTPANIQKQGRMSILYRVPSTCTTAQIQTKIDTVQQNLVPSSSIVNDGLYHSIEIPTIFGSSTATIRMFSTATCTGDIYFDSAVVAQGLGTQNLMLDNTYVGFVSNTGAISGTNKTFFSGCVVSTGIHTCTIASASVNVTVAPVCTATNATGGTVAVGIFSPTSSSVQFSPITGTTAVPFNYSCTKSGVDYLNSSANVYSQASANYGWTAQSGGNSITGTTSNPTKASTPATDEVWYQRSGGDLEVRLAYRQTATTGAAAGSGDYLFAIPSSSGCTIDTTKVKANSTVVASGTSMAISGDSTVGVASYNGTSLQEIGRGSVSVYDSTRVRLGLTMNSGGTGAYTFYLGSANSRIAAQPNVDFSASFKIPCVGWSNANSIVGSFESMNSSQGSVLPDLQGLYFGSGSNCATECTTGTCSVCTRVGTKITSATWQSTGCYDLNGINGSKYICTGNGISSGTSGSFYQLLASSTATSVRVCFRTSSTEVNAGFATVTCHGEK